MTLPENISLVPVVGRPGHWNIWIRFGCPYTGAAYRASAIGTREDAEAKALRALELLHHVPHQTVGS